MRKNTWLRLLVAICVSLNIAAPGLSLSVANEESAPAVKLSLLNPPAGGFFAPGLATKVSLDLRNIDVIEALKFLALKSNMNIVPTQKVSGRVTLRVENVPVKDVFDIMLRSNNLAYDQKGEIYNVMTESEYKSFYGKNFSDTRVVQVFHLKYAIPEQAFSLLDAIKSDIGRLLVEPDSGTVMIMDTPERIKEAQGALESLEQKGAVKVFTLKYAHAKEVEEQLKQHLDLKKVGSIRADERNNQIIVQTLPERMKDIEELVVSLDKKTKEVLIDAKIIKIRLSNEKEEGIQWEGLFGFLAEEAGMAYIGSTPFAAVQAASAAWRSRQTVLNDMGRQVGSYPFSGTTSNLSSSSKVSPGEKIHIGMISSHRDYDVIIKYLQTLGKTKIVSTPSLAVINNQEARIHVGERRAYVTTTTTTGATTTTVAESVTYVDIGIQLAITPTINEDGFVVMKIKPEISSVVDNITTSSDNLIPIIDTSTLETTVMAKDGATIMLGGLGREDKVESAEGIPFLSRIPFLGFLFRSSSKSVVRNELIVLLTPYIFEGDALITPKSKDKEMFDFKKKKNFDVFRKDLSEEKIASLELKEEYSRGPKGPKDYDGKLVSASSSGPAATVFMQKQDALSEDTGKTKENNVLAETEKTFATKGFREYDVPQDSTVPVAVKGRIYENQAPVVEGQKPYYAF